MLEKSVYIQPKKLPIIGPFEVILHNKPHDCWLSFLGKVFNVTPLIKKHEDENCIKPLIALAGKDVSHWFNERTGEIQTYIHPITGVEVPFCPHGVIPDVSYDVPTTLWRPLDGPPWWKNPKYQVGILTKSSRPLRIVNMLICKEIQINVCCEDTFFRIQERYSAFNSECKSYTWVYLDKIIDMSKTLEENGIPDERELFTEIGMPKNYYVPCVFLYYNDDLSHFEDLTDSEEEEMYKNNENIC